jgi:hypothetical protein
MIKRQRGDNDFGRFTQTNGLAWSHASATILWDGQH